MDELWHLSLSRGGPQPFDHVGQDVLLARATDFASLDDAAPWREVSRSLVGAMHPPLYLQSLRLWRDLFGPDDRTAQAYSVLWSLLALSFGFAAVRLCFDRWLAAVAMAALAVSFVQIYLATEIRGYAMMAGLTAAAIWLMVRVEVLGPTARRGVLLGLLTLPMALTHYFAIGACVAVGVFILLRFRARPLAWALAALGVAFATFAVHWGGPALRQFTAVRTDFALQPDVPFWERSLVPALAMPFSLLADVGADEHPLILLSMFAYLLPVFLRRRAPHLLPWWVAGVAVVTCLLVVDAIRGTGVLHFIRYAAGASLSLPPLMILCLAAIHPRLGHAFGALLFAGLACLVGQSVRFDSPQFAELASRTAERMGPGEPVIAVSVGPIPWMTDAVVLQLLHQPGGAPRPLLKTSRVPTPDQLRQLRQLTPESVATAWVVTGASHPPLHVLMPAGYSALEAVLGTFPGTAYRIGFAPPPAGNAPTQPGSHDRETTSGTDAAP